MKKLTNKKMGMTDAQANYIESLAEQLGIEDHRYYVNNHFGLYRSDRPGNYVTKQQASELIDQLKDQLAEM